MYRNRYRRILWFFGKVILSFIWWDVILPKIGFRRLSQVTRNERFRRIAAAYRAEAVRLGGVMIKVGQFLSARVDVLPQAITNELAGLQDEVAAENPEALFAVALSELGMPLDEKFEMIDPNPIAAASIGQVHRAILREVTESGVRDVVVKIQRPDIEKIVDVDLSALRIVAGWLMHYGPLRKRANVPALLEEFSRSLNEELDYINEGKNAERFAENFSHQKDIRVPIVVWSHTTRRVLTLEYLQAIKITDYAQIDVAGIDRSKVARTLFDTYLKQIFEDQFFHADPHPGNLFVLPLAGDEQEAAGQNWKLVFVDFGMTGSVSDHLLVNLREILIAVGTRDARRIITTYQSLGALLPGADLDLLEKATNKVFERFWGKTAPEMLTLDHKEAVAFAQEFSELIYDLPFQVPENLILLARCLGILSGICTGLDYNFNVWTSIAPYVQKLLAADDSGGWRFWLAEVGSFLSVLAGLPRKTDALLTRAEQGKLEVQTPEVNRRISRLETSIKKLAGALVLAALLVIGTQLYLAKEMPLAIASAVLAAICAGWVIFSR